MSRIHIVTDSTAHFTNLHFVEQNPVTVVPNTITIAGKAYRENVDISSEDAMRLITHERMLPVLMPPSEADFAAVYRNLAVNCDAIISIHPSRKILPVWERARAAAGQNTGHCEIFVIDSEDMSAAQGMLVRVAARAIANGASAEDVIRIMRGAIERIFSVYYVDSINPLLQNGIMSSSHTILGAMLGIKPFLTVEDGELRQMEKVRTRAQAIDRLVEFVVEFTDIEEVVILQNKPYISDQTRMLQDRLAVEFPGRHFPYALYGPSLTALLGAEITGIVLLESEVEFYDDGY
jgi:DegV family protein with EDD domain